MRVGTRALLLCGWLIGCAMLLGAAGSRPAFAESPSVPRLPAAPACVRVIYHHGQLAIRANGCPLQEVLRAIHRQTGAVIDAAPALAGNLVAGEVGPGNPAAVLAELLNRGEVNYVILSGRSASLSYIIVTQPVAFAPEPKPLPPPADNGTVEDAATNSSPAAEPQTVSFPVAASTPAAVVLPGRTAPASTLSASNGLAANEVVVHPGQTQQGNTSAGTPSVPSGGTGSYSGGSLNIPGIPPSVLNELCQLYGGTCQEVQQKISSAPPPPPPPSCQHIVVNTVTQGVRCAD